MKWQNAADYKGYPGKIVVGFFWILTLSGDVELMYGEPGGHAAKAVEAGSEDAVLFYGTSEYASFAWLETPQPPVSDRRDQAWSTRDILAKLSEAAGILLDSHNYDDDGWEEIAMCRELAKQIVEQNS